METHRLDTEEAVYFYENEFYPFSSFSAFAIRWKDKLFTTAEHVYHWEKFDDEELKEKIKNALSAHEALKIAHENEDKVRSDWLKIRVSVMEEIVRAKVDQHPYVLKKLMDSGTREIVEDSWRDSFWGWGQDKNGRNELGKIWMRERERRKTFAKLKI